MDIQVVCAACGHTQHFVGVVPFRAECESCAADVHVCMNCRFHDQFVANECVEDQADPVARKDRRNLCEYWKPKGSAGRVDNAADAAKAKLAALFGGAPTVTSSSETAQDKPTTAAEEAKRKLEALFTKK
jgi:hypothetical protein